MSSLSPAEPVLLDTHYWIWLQGGTDEITAVSRRTIERAARHGQLLLSVISVWELGMLEAKNRVLLHVPCEQWVEQALATPGLNLVPLTPEIALESSRLPGGFHGDPADRIIVASARKAGARLLTRDQKLIEYARHDHLKLA